MLRFIVIKVFYKNILTQGKMNQNPAFLWTIGYNINPEQLKENEISMKRLYKKLASTNMNLFNDFRHFGYVFLSN